MHHFQTSPKLAGPIKAKFHVEPPWVGGKKVYSGGLGQMTRLQPCPYMVKTLYKSSSPEPKGLGMQYWGLGPNKVCSNDDRHLFFMARSNLLPYAFLWENIHFFRKNVRKLFSGRNLQQMTRVTKGLC